MASTTSDIWQSFIKDNQLYAHPRTKDWFLANPVPILVIVAVWLYFCLYAGPRFMKNRRPYELKNTLIVYNFVQICLSTYIFVQGGRLGWFTRYNWLCQPIDDVNDPHSDNKIAALVWWYLFAKLTELLDTVFFVIRKKDNQISTLHVYHHAIMPFAAWLAIKFAPGGHGSLVGFINSFIHIIMYSYYLIAGLGPQYQKYLWWKKHLTSLQLIQFVILLWHNFSVLFRDCNFPRFWNYCCTVEAIVFIYLFGKFYYKSYVANAKKKIN